MEAETARVALCNRKIKAGFEALVVPKSKVEAQGSRDAVARAIYTSLFDWLMDKINKRLTAASSEASSVRMLTYADVC